MALTNLPAPLRNLVRTLDDEERGILRTSMGIDVETWHLDETVFSRHEETLREFRAAVATELNTRGASTETYGEKSRCSGCGVVGEGAELFLTLIHGTTICDKCLNLLEEYARHGGK